MVRAGTHQKAKLSFVAADTFGRISCSSAVPGFVKKVERTSSAVSSHRTPAAALRPPLTPRTVRERRLGGLPSLQPSPRVLLVGQRAALNKSQCEREAEAEAARTAARKGRARVRGGNLMVGFFTAR